MASLLERLKMKAELKAALSEGTTVLQPRSLREESPPKGEPVAVEIPSAPVDDVTCRRIAAFCAYGLTDMQIAAALLLSREQIQGAKASDVYALEFAKTVQEKTLRQIDLEEGWDTLEADALKSVMEGMRFNRDPQFALTAAAVANKAKRRSPASFGRTIDATKAANMIVLTMNKTYVTQVSANGTSGTNGGSIANGAVEAKGGAIGTPGLSQPVLGRFHDVPTPKKVAELLGVGLNGVALSAADELRAQAEAAGVFLGMLEEE